MPVVKTKAYYSEEATENAEDYLKDLEKVIDALKLEAERLVEKNAIQYSINADKTTLMGEQLVSGINCKASLAGEVIKRTRDAYYRNGHSEGKPKTYFVTTLLRARLDDNGNPVLAEDGNMIHDERFPVYHDENGDTVDIILRKQSRIRQSYMFIQSFPPPDSPIMQGKTIDPRLVHQIGQEFIEELQKELGFEMAGVMGTHCDKKHLHNHFLVSAFDLHGHKKFPDSMVVIKKMRDISDRLALKYDIPIIIEPENGHSMSYAEWNLKKNGQSFKEQMRQDIQYCLSKTTNYFQFVEKMKSMGYTIRETENTITYINPAKTGKCRGKNLGAEYSKESIMKYFEAISPDKKHTLQEQYVVDVADIVAKEDRERKKALYVNRYDINGRRRSDLEILILKAIKLIQYFKDKLNKVEVDSNSPMHQSYQWKLERLYEACEIANTLGIQNFKDLNERITEAGKNVAVAKSEYNDLKDAEKHLKALEDYLVKFKELREDFDVAMNITNPNLPTYNMEDMKKEAELHPNLPSQRRELFTLLHHHPLYFTVGKYKNIPRKQTEEMIAFLKGEIDEKPACLFSREELRIDSEAAKIDIENYLIAPTESEKMEQRAKLFPCTSAQRREFYVLLQEKPFYHSADKFSNISYHQMEEAIAFLKGETIEKPDCILDQAEFEDKSKRIKYERIAAKMLQTIGEKNQGNKVPKPITQFLQDYNIDTSNMDYKDMVHIYTYFKPWEPAYEVNQTDEKLPQSKVEEIEFLLKMTNLELNIPVKDLSPKDASLVSRDLMLKLVRPDAIVRQADLDFNEAIADFSYEDRKKVTEYRKACQEMMSLGYDLNNVDLLLQEISQELKAIAAKKEQKDLADDAYKTLMQIKEYCGLAQNKHFVYGNQYQKKEKEKDEIEEEVVVNEDKHTVPEKNEEPEKELKPRRKFSQDIPV